MNASHPAFFALGLVLYSRVRMCCMKLFCRSLVCVVLLMGSATFAESGVTIKGDTPADIRAYLEDAIQRGKAQHADLLANAKNAVAKSQDQLENTKKLYRKRQAKQSDVQAAEKSVKVAKDALGAIPAQASLAFAAFTRFDQPGTLGAIPHGIGVSRIIDASSAVVYPFVERSSPTKNTKADGIVFTDTEELNKEIVPADRAVILDGVSTADRKQGQRIPGDHQVYRVGEIKTVDDEKLYLLHPVDIQKYLIHLDR